MRREQGNARGADVLVPRRRPLLTSGKVDPQLDAMEKAAARDESLGWAFDVKDSRAGRHPLRRPIRDQAAAAGGILVLKGPVDHVRDGLEPTMRVPCRSLRLARAVFHLAHLVHVNEGVEVALVEPVK